MHLLQGQGQETQFRESEPARWEYDVLASIYDRRWRRYIDATLRSVLESVHFQGSERVLDIACGTGELESLLLSRWSDLPIVGVDISQGMLRQAAAKVRRGRVFWVQADASHLPFLDEAFDRAVCANSFHYFHSPVQALHEIHRVLRPGGQFLLVDWCDDYLSCKLCSMWLRWTEPAFFKAYTIQDCRTLLRQAGFEVTEADHFRVCRIWGMMRCICRRKTRLLYSP
jgi:ubiquinone/menaquinone biosynthesis C-methylase UbiE